MSQTFKTQADVMVATAGKVDNTNDEVQGELTRLQGVVDSVRGSWVGQAQVSFDDLMQRYNTSAQQLREALAGLEEAVTDTPAEEVDVQQEYGEVTAEDLSTDELVQDGSEVVEDAGREADGALAGIDPVWDMSVTGFLQITLGNVIGLLMGCGAMTLMIGWMLLAILGHKAFESFSLTTLLQLAEHSETFVEEHQRRHETF